LRTQAALGSDTLLDLDGDGRLELLRLSMPFSVLEIAEILVTRSVDTRFSIYRLNNERQLETKPWATLEIDLPINFETFRARGFLPAWHLDLNNDRQLDLLASGGGTELEVTLGGGERPYHDRAAAQEVDTQGLLRSGDLDGDGLPDLVMFDPITSDATVRLLRNRGILPGTDRSRQQTPHFGRPRPQPE
jgi:hypothetical protein